MTLSGESNEENSVDNYNNKIAGGLFAVLLLTADCNVERTQEARGPDLDVDVDPGQWPKYNVKWADVDVGTTERTITIPKLEVRREQETVQVPYIDINSSGAGDREELESQIRWSFGCRKTWMFGKL